MIPLSEPNLSGNEWKYVKDCLNSTWISSIGSYVNRFEELSAEYCKVSKAIDLATTLFIAALTYNGQTMRLYRMLTKMGCITGFMARNMTPLADVERSYRSKKFNNLRSLLYPPKAARYFRDFVARIVRINAIDYDEFLRKQQAPHVAASEKYCLFLDDYLPYHPDFKIIGIETVEPDAYYRSLNSFFDFIEKKYGIAVWIAAHPKSNYKTNPFNGRRVIHHKTSTLTKEAEFVLAHASTSVSFAILFDKPVLFCYNNEIDRAFKGSRTAHIKSSGQMLNAHVVNMDVTKDLDSLPNTWHVSAADYSNYKRLYLTSDQTANVLSEDIVVHTLKSITFA